ncbi:hypothetical protein [Maribacter sp. 4G9]|uniref:hypothetical protein n=1 Tax=Maribacter sp. 4G9 TaxID=1889777 RepID=UPI000C154DA9|nr:hypothetical protein [Maribacter sp. 4G9]PIB38427.1 hypothetical protein BFP75_16100 [Maribacter sp. 4G9]
MNLKVKRLILLANLLGLLFLSRTEFGPNCWRLLTSNDYDIPIESSMFQFKVTQMNTGSGEYWLYGEDNENYYTMMEKGDNAPYRAISKSVASNIQGFEALDYTTWNLTE